jgi:probable addiction module antidote protein
MALKTPPVDAAELLGTEEAVGEVHRCRFRDRGPAFIARARGTAVRVRNMSKLAEEIGMSCSALYRALSGKGNLGFATITKVMHALGLQLAAKRRAETLRTKRSNTKIA